MALDPSTSHAALTALSAIGREVSFDGDDLIRRRGEPCDRVTLVIDGEVRVEALSDTGRPIELYRLRPGEPCVLEVSAALSGADYPVQAVAQSDGRAIAVPTPRLVAAIAESEPVRQLVFSAMSWRLRDVMALAGEIAFHQIDQRLAALLLRERDESDRVHATHEQLAGRLGTAREVVSRLIGRFGEDGAIRSERGRITVVDPDRLTERDGGH